MSTKIVKDGYEIYTDGGVRNNQERKNIGSWAFVNLHKGKLTEMSEISLDTTNQVMEMVAILEAMKSVGDKSLPVRIHSDSSYCVNGLNKWVYLWEKAGWKKGKHQKNQNILNLEIWKELHYLRNEFSDITFIKVKGHSDNLGNALADKIVNETMDKYETNMR